MDENTQGTTGAGRTAARPILTRFASYRDILEAMYSFKHARHPGFSWRRFASMSGIKSPNYLQLVVQGKKNLSVEVARDVARVCELSDLEQAYFLALLRFETASEESDELEKAVHAARMGLEMQSVSRAQAQVLSEWLHAVVSEMVHLPEFKPAGSWVAEKLHGVVTSEEASAALEQLLGAGILRRTEAGGITPSQEAMLVRENACPHSLRSFHCENLLKVSEIAKSVPREQSTFSVVNAAVSRRDLPELLAHVRSLSRSFSGAAMRARGGNPDLVVQFGCFLLPLTRD